MDIDTPAQLFTIRSTDSERRTHEITYVRDLSLAEYTAYREACHKLNDFNSWQALIYVAVENYKELKQTLTELRSFQPLQNPKGELRDLLHLTINRRLVNFLSTARLFLDHTEARLKRLYGKDSGPLHDFKTATGWAFDNVFAYRFLYGLRNYALHSGMPILGISFSSRDTSTGEENSLEYSFDARDLLQGGGNHWHNFVKANLELGPEKLPVSELVDTFMQELHRIDETVFRSEFTGLSEAGKTILRVVSDAVSSETTPIVGRLHPHNDGEGANLSFEDVPLEALAHLGLVTLRHPNSILL